MLEFIIKVVSDNYKPILIVLAMGFCVLGGWKANTYYTGYQLSISQKIEKKVDDAIDKLQQESAKNLVETQKTIKENATKIVETKVPVIIEKKVYQNVCLDEDGLQVLKELKLNSTEGKNYNEI